MNVVTLLGILLLVSIHFAQSLKCRSNDPQEEEEYRRIVQKCAGGKYGRSKNNDENSSNESDESNDSSTEGSIYEHDFFSGNNKNRAGNDNNKNNNDNNQRMENGPFRNSTMNRNMRNQNWDSGMQQRVNGSRFPNDGDDELECLAQCTYAELNAVDQRGYPERMALIAAMNRRTRDPALRDFQEESIVECFHFLSSMSNLNKCEFADRLNICFLEKARERCDDIGK